MQVIDADTVARATPFERLVPALRELFASGAEVPPRQVLTLADPAGGAAVTSLVMSAWDPGRYYAVKVINIAPGNAERGLPGLHASVLLHDAITGVPLALMDGDAITTRRTAAASALAASWLAPADAREMLVVGAGRVAALLPAAYRAVRPIERVTVWARRPEAAEVLASRWRSDGFAVTVATDLANAARHALIVSCATLATAPVVRGAWLAPGSHLDLIGSFTPAMREADDACFRGASVWVDTEEALVKAGELLAPMASGAWRSADLRGTLAQLARGEVHGRSAADERTVFKSVGTALEDLAAAMLVQAAAG
ncbi:ornithine cyclodeaminase family protein [Rubrivivax albus]|uniref:Ornithine cyclodeaminase family protein n=1 Tax=Rubrivivax albus TaxID=2499835 RepID=A0A437JWD8_9BURK|nr:ornithine cyclodeaminase family protein [Rubrivivax albus]RVT51569.1 ornithine cyclodeaminase family protein [Rubrivivax albus]